MGQEDFLIKEGIIEQIAEGMIIELITEGMIIEDTIAEDSKETFKSS